MEHKNYNWIEIYDKIDAKKKLTYGEFLFMAGGNFEMQFIYKGRHYGVTQFEGYEFFEHCVKESLQIYPTIEEFAEKANTNGILLKDIWDSVEELDFA